MQLPATPDTAPVPPDSTAGTSSAAARPSRVLVVDDNVDTADGTAKLLTLSGHVVRVAYNGPDAVAVSREHQPEVVLLDIGLPGMDGYEVAARLRREECCEDAIIIAVSGYGEEQARHRSEESGISNPMFQQVNIDELFSLMERT